MKFRYESFGFLAIFYQLFGIPVTNFPAFYEHNRERPKEQVQIHLLYGRYLLHAISISKFHVVNKVLRIFLAAVECTQRTKISQNASSGR